MPAGSDEGDSADDEDGWGALALANTDTERVDGKARRISLDVAFIQCEHQLGGAWVYAPGRWDTSDGCVPVRLVWAYFRALGMARALSAMETAHGIGLAFAGADSAGVRARDETYNDAYPKER
ncbi:MAG TPA: hypothetical protein VIP11_22040 [Gemmatimonadaceae bacterium]